MKQKKKFWSMIVCCVMVLAICSPVFTTAATVDTEIPMLTDGEMEALRACEHSMAPMFEWYDCPNCPAGQMLAMVCVRPMTPSHTTMHSTSSGTCSGHTCELNHSKCPDESWCQAEAVVY